MVDAFNAWVHPDYIQHNPNAPSGRDATLEVLAAALGKLSSIDIPEGGTLDVADALAKYDALFVFSAKIGIGAGILVLLLTPLIKRWMHGVR